LGATLADGSALAHRNDLDLPWIALAKVPLPERLVLAYVCNRLSPSHQALLAGCHSLIGDSFKKESFMGVLPLSTLVLHCRRASVEDSPNGELGAEKNKCVPFCPPLDL
jgi:hypothetical protein